MAKARMNLTEGNIGRQLMVFALPYLLSNLLLATYNLADTFIIARFIGVSGVAAANSGGQIMNVLINITGGLSLGGTVLVGQFFGAKDEDSLRRTTSTFLCIAAVLSVILTAFAFIFSKSLLQFIGTPPEVFDDAHDFLRIYCAGIIFVFGYNAISGLFRGVGNSLIPLMFVTVSILLNIVLDLVFVIVFHWGVQGAALATTISLGVSCLSSVFYFIKERETFHFDFRKIVVDFKLGAKLLFIGVPTAVQSSIFGLSILFMTTFINKYGVEAAAAAGIGSRVDSLFLLPINAIAAASSAMIAQNLGAGKIDRVRKIVFQTILMNFILVTFTFTISQVFAPVFIGLYTDNAEVLSMGTTYLRTTAFNHIFLLFLVSFNALAIGAGHTIYPLFVTIMNGFVFRVPLGLFFENVMGMGLSGVFMGMGFANIGGAIAGYIYYRLGFWKKSMQKQAEETACENVDSI